MTRQDQEIGKLGNWEQGYTQGNRNWWQYICGTEGQENMK